jgi:uncharacterized protein YbjQ (UPF0145 family)
MLVVTTENVPGFEVSAAIGEVCGVSVLPRNPYTGGVKTLTGDINPRVKEDLADARDHAIAEMVRAARRKGANAVIAMRFDNRDVSDRWAEICAYGTAVRLTAVRPAHVRVETATRRAIGTARPPELPR